MKRILILAAASGICFLAPCPAAHAQNVKAESGGVAIGGNVSGSTINIGVPQEKINELVRERTKPFEELTISQKEVIGLLREKLDLNNRQIRAALDILGERDIPPERLAAKLAEVAERYKALQATALAQPGDDAKITALKAEAQQAIEAGNLEKADAVLADVATEQRRARDRSAVNAADTLARRGEIAMTRLRYGEAAEHFADAAAEFPRRSEHEDKRIGYLKREAEALYQQGDEFGDNDALRTAIERFRRLVDLKPRARVPREWAEAQNELGIALESLGGRESGTARLEEAIAAYREALKEWTRERAPRRRAKAQNNLAHALMRRAGHESGTAWLEQAVEAFRAALQEWTRERVPLQWAQTQNNLGIALRTLGQRESGTARLEQAVEAFREALQERTREHVPLQWAVSTRDQGVALMLLADRTNNAAMAERAVAQIEPALDTVRDGGDPRLNHSFDTALQRARAILQRLRQP